MQGCVRRPDPSLARRAGTFSATRSCPCRRTSETCRTRISRESLMQRRSCPCEHAVNSQQHLHIHMTRPSTARGGAGLDQAPRPRLRDHAKPSASSLAARAAVTTWLGSPRSSFYFRLLSDRWLLTQLPHVGGPQPGAAARGSRRTPSYCTARSSTARPPSRCRFSFVHTSHAKPSAVSFAARSAVIPLQGSPRSSGFLLCRCLSTQLPPRRSLAPSARPSPPPI